MIWPQPAIEQVINYTQTHGTEISALSEKKPIDIIHGIFENRPD